MEKTKLTLNIFYDGESMSKSEIIKDVASILLITDKRLLNQDEHHQATDTYLLEIK